MRLSEMDNIRFNPDIILLTTPSSKLSIFIEDKMKRKFGSIGDSIINVENKNDLKQVRDVLGVMPYNTDKWFVRVNLDKFNNKDLHKVIQDSTTCVFFCTCEKYKTFKEFKELFEKRFSVADLYMTWLRRDDIIYLYNAFTTSETRLTPALFNTVVSGYASDIDALFNLFLNLNGGKVYKKESDIVNDIGLGSLSTEAYVFQLLKPLSGSAKGLQTVMKTRLAYGLDMGSNLGWSTYYNYLNHCIKSMVEIKILLISGVIYKSIRDLPEGYDETKLTRYNRHVWKLKETPLSDLLLLRNAMGSKVWRSELEFLDFLYSYYNIKAKNKAKEMVS